VNSNSAPPTSSYSTRSTGFPDNGRCGQGIFHSRQYEEHIRQVVRENLHSNDIVLDVGANIGAITLLAASVVGSAGRVIAVEPNPDNLQLLYRGILVNGFSNVTVIPCAASDNIGIVSLTGGTSNTHITSPNITDISDHLAQTVPLEHWLGGFDRLDFVNMDIEGHEPRALLGCTRSFSDTSPYS
jgi:FkbM family methyltransferase